MMLLTAPTWREVYVGTTRDPFVLREDAGASRGVEGAREVVGRRTVAPFHPSPSVVRIAKWGAPRSIARRTPLFPPRPQIRLLHAARKSE